MFLYGITLFPLTEEMRDADPPLLSPFYDDDTASDGSARRGAAQLRLMMDRGPGWGYFPEPAKSLFNIRQPRRYGEEKKGQRAGGPKSKLRR